MGVVVVCRWVSSGNAFLVFWRVLDTGPPSTATETTAVPRGTFFSDQGNLGNVSRHVGWYLLVGALHEASCDGNNGRSLCSRKTTFALQAWNIDCLRLLRAQRRSTLRKHIAQAGDSIEHGRYPSKRSLLPPRDNKIPKRLLGRALPCPPPRCSPSKPYLACWFQSLYSFGLHLHHDRFPTFFIHF